MKNGEYANGKSRWLRIAAASQIDRPFGQLPSYYGIIIVWLRRRLILDVFLTDPHRSHSHSKLPNTPWEPVGLRKILLWRWESGPNRPEISFHRTTMRLALVTIWAALPLASRRTPKSDRLLAPQMLPPVPLSKCLIFRQQHVRILPLQILHSPECWSAGGKLYSVRRSQLQREPR